MIIQKEEKKKIIIGIVMRIYPEDHRSYLECHKQLLSNGWRGCFRKLVGSHGYQNIHGIRLRKDVNLKENCIKPD